MTLAELTPGLWHAEHDHFMGPVHFRGRMTVARARDGLWVHSPIAIDDALAAEVAALGAVKHLVAPNLYHHSYLAAASARWPEATVWAPAALREKARDLRVDQVLDEGARATWGGIDCLRIDGAPRFAEWVFHVPAAKALIVTDLVFNIREAKGWFSRLVFRLEGVYGRVGQSPLWGWAIKERAATRAACRRMLAWDFETVVLAHGAVLSGPTARADLEHALHKMLSGPKALGSYV